MLGFWLYDLAGGMHEALTVDGDTVQTFPDERTAREVIGRHNVQLFKQLQRDGQLLIGLTVLEDDA